MNSIKIATKMCIGCGLCHSEFNLKFKQDNKGFLIIDDTISPECQDFINNVCPVVGTSFSDESCKDIWGERIEVYEGFSTDKDIRKQASSAGVITSLGLHLLKSGLIDGIIHIGADKTIVYKTQTIISSDEESLVNNCGSRYSISSPWYNLKNLIDPSKKYMAIGKPCDITALRNARDRLHLYENIIYLVSFFCAGLPSNTANQKLLKELCCNEESCIGLRYRGNGWPGYATAIDKQGNEHALVYSKAWGGILGRDVHTLCRICIDGIGLNSDIACGDLWYLDKDNPDFTERDGRNIIITRTPLGEELLKQAIAAGYISCSKYDNFEDLKKIQKYQYTRRATMKAKIIANKILLRPVPKYNKKMITKYSKMIPFSERKKVFLGTVKRILTKKI